MRESIGLGAMQLMLSVCVRAQEGADLASVRELVDQMRPVINAPPPGAACSAEMSFVASVKFGECVQICVLLIRRARVTGFTLFDTRV